MLAAWASTIRNTAEVTMTVTIRLADARKVEPIEADVMIVDPPYGKHVHDNTTSQSAKGGTRRNHLGFDHLSEELRNAIAIQASAVTRWSLIYSDIEGLHDWREACALFGATYIRAMPWVRWSMPQLSGDRPPQGFELVTAYWGQGKGKKSWNGPGNLTHLDHKCLRGEEKHKCEKPLDQALDLVSWFSNPGETIVDLCVGSGVVGLACKILGRNYVGYELDPVWVEKAANRIAAYDVHDNPTAMLTLSERDRERWSRWCEAQERRAEELAKIKAHTEKVKRRNANCKNSR